MRERGRRCAHAAQLATLDTDGQGLQRAAQRLHDEWRARAAEVGLGRTELEAVLDRRAPRGALAPDPTSIAAHLSSPAGLTADASAFDRRAVLRGLATLHRAAWTVVSSSAWRTSGFTRMNLALEPSSKRSMRAPGTRRPRCSRRSAADRAREGRRRRRAGIVPPQRARGACPCVRLCSLTSSADSGSSHSRPRAAGSRSCAPPRARARRYALRGGSRRVGIHGSARLRMRAGCSRRGRAAGTRGHRQRDDRAGAAGSPSRLGPAAGLGAGDRSKRQAWSGRGPCWSSPITRRRRSSKMVLVGDDRQLPELEAGGAFRGLAERVGGLELRRVHRQAADWDRAALEQLRRGNVDSWADGVPRAGAARRPAICDRATRATRE